MSEESAVTTAADVAGTLTGTGQGGATWNNGETFDPDAQFDGSTGTITAGHAVSSDGNFTVSFWVKPSVLSQTVISQDGTEGAIFKIYPSINTYWAFAMARTDDPASTVLWDAAISATGTTKLGIWYHITATYDASTDLMSLYVNDKLAGTKSHTTLSDKSNGNLQIARMRVTAASTGYSGYTKSEIANVQTWNSVVNPVGR
ncbi:LamG domain-containing protein [Actinoplanes sp. NPDC051851]|uniref:LamG domain-containing protein n=1 Tax=Actinoplanes sp. NPDC051851 TaxID=3154753 RepID=UPI003435ABDF